MDSQDWGRISAQARQWCPCIAGTLFGAAWWCWADAVFYTKVHLCLLCSVTHETSARFASCVRAMPRDNVRCWADAVFYTKVLLRLLCSVSHEHSACTATCI